MGNLCREPVDLRIDYVITVLIRENHGSNILLESPNSYDHASAASPLGLLNQRMSQDPVRPDSLCLEEIIT